MPQAVVESVVADVPSPALSGSRSIGRQLNEQVEKLPARVKWTRIGQFPEKARQAHWFAARLRKQYGPKGYEFTSRIEADGVGRLYARLAPQS